MNKLVLAVFALVLLSACDQGDKELKELKARLEEHQGTYERIKDGNINVTELQFLDFN